MRYLATSNGRRAPSQEDATAVTHFTLYLSRITTSHTMEKPSVILCSGAWHNQSHLEPCIPHFEKTGHRIVPQTLPSVGNDHGNWEDDVNTFQATIVKELNAKNNVCLIVHSAAGLVGCEAVNRILDQSEDHGGKITRIVCLASFLDVAEIIEHIMAYIRIDTERGICHMENAEEAFYNHMAPQDAQKSIEALTWQKMYPQPVLSSSRWTSVPLTYLMCTRDNSVPLRVQERVAGEYSMDVAKIDSGHCPFTTQPEKFVEVVDGILRSSTKASGS